MNAKATLPYWFKVRLQPMMDHWRQKAAKRVNCPLENLFLLLNATECFNVIIKAQCWQSGDTLLMVNCVYKSVGKTIRYLQSQHKFNLLLVRQP